MYKLTDLYKQIKEEETQSSPQYKIYCDMDGVLVDFDRGYKELTGKETHHADVQGTTEFWNDKNCEVLTSEGKTRKDTDGTKAKWCIVQSELPNNEYGGIAFLSYPANYNHPEPMRIWTLGTNGRGDMFLEHIAILLDRCDRSVHKSSFIHRKLSNFSLIFCRKLLISKRVRRVNPIATY